MNIGIFSGRLTADATFWNGSDPSKNLAKFTIAVTDPWNAEKTDYFQITCFGKKADYVMNGQQKGRFLKGCEVEVSGPIHLGNYKTQQGEDRYYINIIAETLYSKVHKNFGQGTSNNTAQNTGTQDYNQNGNVPVQQNGTTGYGRQDYNNRPATNGASQPQYNSGRGYNNRPVTNGSSIPQPNNGQNNRGGSQYNGGQGYNKPPVTNTPSQQMNADFGYNNQQFNPNNAPMPKGSQFTNLPDSIPEEPGYNEQEGGFRPATYNYE